MYVMGIWARRGDGVLVGIVMVKRRSKSEEGEKTVRLVIRRYRTRAATSQVETSLQEFR